MTMTTFFRIAACVAAAAFLNELALAANKTKPSPPPTEIVRRVLESEADSSNPSVDRRQLLTPDTRPQSDPAPTWWQSGFLQSGKEWRPYDMLQPEGEDVRRLDEYRELRAGVKDQPHGQWKLANWCRKNGLLDQERVHLIQVLAERDSTVNYDAVYERLGCQKINNSWVSPKERTDAAKLKSDIERSLKRWGSKLDSIAQRLEGTAKQRAQAEKQLGEIDDPSAVPAIVTTLCAAKPSLAEDGVHAIGQIPGYEASRALAGQAVFSPWKQVRTRAIEQLTSRKLEEFVPDLMMVLTNPIRSSSNSDVALQKLNQSMTTPNGHSSTYINWDYVWIDESYDSIRIGVRRLFPLSTSANQLRIASIHHPEIRSQYDVNSGQRLTSNSLVLAIFEMIEQADVLDRNADLINDFRTTTNERVGKVLSSCSGEPMSSDPRDWWKWWAQYSSVALPSQKNVVIVDERPSQPNVPSLSVHTLRFSCLVAGTPIWTDRGPIAVEKIQLGDRVLSKDVETGELCYKPVLQTTMRQPTSVLSIQVEDEAIVASPGHQFWVSGEGWTKTWQLSSQMPMHTVTGMRRIVSIEDQGRKEKVYNLVVGDFHTYFVGKSMLLSHDVLPPEMTNVKIPGLAVQSPDSD